MVSECIPSVWEGEHTLVGLPCMKTVSGVPPQVPATLFDTGSHISRHLSQAGYTSWPDSSRDLPRSVSDLIIHGIRSIGHHAQL